MKVSPSEAAKPLVVLVQAPSMMRLWMESRLSRQFRVCVFASSEDALAFVRSRREFDVLITDLDLALSTIGGCNIARDVRSRFPGVPIFVFPNVPADDHRLVILRGMKGVRFLFKPLDVLRITGLLRAALRDKPAVR